MDGLEKQVKDIIECLYDCIYEGDLKVKKDGNFYVLTLYLQNQSHACGGVVLANQCETDEEFLKYVKCQLKKNRLDYSSHAQLRIYHNDDIIL